VVRAPAHRLLYHSTLGLRVIKKKKKHRGISGRKCWTAQVVRSVMATLQWHLRRIDSCITQLKAQGHSRTCDESKEEEEGLGHREICGRKCWTAQEVRSVMAECATRSISACSAGTGPAA